MSKNKTYLNFEDLPVYNFYKIVETSDMRWFYKKFRSEKDIVISEDEVFELANRYKDIYDERVKYTAFIMFSAFFLAFASLRLDLSVETEAK